MPDNETINFTGDAPAGIAASGLLRRDPRDGVIDVNNLPAIPWTRDALGVSVFRALAEVAGVGDLQDHQRNPSLDPRTFGESRAKRLIRLANAKGVQAQALLEEGKALQARIDATLPAIKGRPRKAGAPPLSPAKTTFREAGPKPSRWS